MSSAKTKIKLGLDAALKLFDLVDDAAELVLTKLLLTTLTTNKLKKTEKKVKNVQAAASFQAPGLDGRFRKNGSRFLPVDPPSPW